LAGWLEFAQPAGGDLIFTAKSYLSQGKQHSIEDSAW